jgi:hypothetical protein
VFREEVCNQPAWRRAGVPRFDALIDRVLEVDGAFDEGTAHAFMITYEMSRLNAKPDPAARAKEHSTGRWRSAAGIRRGIWWRKLVAQKNKTEFQTMLRQALRLDINGSLANRELNLAVQRRARWLLSRTDKLFLEAR